MSHWHLNALKQISSKYLCKLSLFYNIPDWGGAMIFSGRVLHQ